MPEVIWILNLESEGWEVDNKERNPESKNLPDYLTWGDGVLIYCPSRFQLMTVGSPNTVFKIVPPMNKTRV